MISLKLMDIVITLTNTFLYTSIVMIIILLCRSLLGIKLGSRSRVAVWIAGIISLIVPVYPRFQLSMPFGLHFYVLGSEVINELGSPVHVPNGEILLGRSELGKWINVIVVIWVAVATLMLFYQIYLYIRLRFKIDSIPGTADKVALSMLESDKLYFDTSINIKVIIPKQNELREIKCPSVFGIKAPVIILPYEQWECFDSDEKKAIITHELLHIKHNDNRKNLFLILLQCIHWFNPLVWIALRKLRLDLETYRDIQVVRELSSPETVSYAESMYKIALANSKKYALSPHCGMLCSSGTGLRLKLLHSKDQKNVIADLAISIIILFILIFIFAKWKISLFHIDHIIMKG